MSTEAATLDDWRNAVETLVVAQRAVRRVYLVSMRGGAIADSVPGICGAWRLSPIAGATVLGDLQRAEAVNGRRDWADVGPVDAPIDLVGNPIGWPLYTALRDHAELAVPNAPLRTVRLESDPAPADLKVAGPPLWRRAEPGNDAALAELLAADIADWVRQCEG